MKNCTIVIIILCLFCVSCKKHDDVFDERAFIESFKEARISKMYKDVENNIDVAISKYEDEKVDREPFVMYASLGSTVGYPEHLYILCYDEDKDALGIGIKEKYIDPNGMETILVEEYPIFIFRSPSIATQWFWIETKFRDSGQKKSEQQWQDYINVDSSKAEEIKKLYHEEWYPTLPDVWLSIPEPNKVEVEMYIYDKEGNKSNSTTVKWLGERKQKETMEAN